jgi:hypothetical protein
MNGPKRLLLPLAAILAGLVALEVVLAVLWSSGESRGSAGLRFQTERLEQFASDYRKDDEELAAQARKIVGNAIHPFSGYSDRTEHEWLPLSRQRTQGGPQQVSILILGGSVAAGFTPGGTDALRAVLKADERFAGKRIVFLTSGQPGFKQPQQLMRLVHFLTQGVEPDLVFDLSGFNEVTVGRANHSLGSHPTHPMHRKWVALAEPPAGDWPLRRDRWVQRRDDLVARARRLSAAPWSWSQLWCDWRARQLDRRIDALFAESEALIAEATAPPGADILGPPFDGEVADIAGAIVDHWRECALSAHALCAARGIPYFAVIQPAAIDPGSQPLLPDELRRTAGLAASWTAGAAEGYPLLRAAGAELRDAGVPCIDLTRVFVDEARPMFRDSVHLTLLGNQLVAEGIGRGMLAALPADWRP